MVRRAEQIRLGGPFDDKAETGPLISAAHLNKVEDYVADAVERGRRGSAAAARGPTTPT